MNRKDREGNNIFEGGFLGLDNIGIFDQSTQLPSGVHLEQSDGTSWIGLYCLTMLKMALELAKQNPSYEDIASKIFEHFLYIGDAMNHIGRNRIPLRDESSSFYYDVLHLPDRQSLHLKVRSVLGIIPLFATQVIELKALEAFSGFRRRVDWFTNNRPDLTKNIAYMAAKGREGKRLLSLVNPEKLKKILLKLLDETEFLSAYGIRSVSKFHETHPYTFSADGREFRLQYEPAESRSGLFGGKSNWRGPIWFPVNYLLVESLQKFHQYLGNDFRVECPIGLGKWMTLAEVATELSQRLTSIFLRNEASSRPVYGENSGCASRKCGISSNIIPSPRTLG